MCDACLRLGSPWLPALHGGENRPRARPKVQLQLARHVVTKGAEKKSVNKPRTTRKS
jgi:hypothetical protein